MNILGMKIPGIVVSILVGFIAIMLVERVEFIRKIVKGG